MARKSRKSVISPEGEARLKDLCESTARKLREGEERWKARLAQQASTSNHEETEIDAGIPANIPVNIPKIRKSFFDTPNDTSQIRVVSEESPRLKLPPPVSHVVTPSSAVRGRPTFGDADPQAVIKCLLDAKKRQDIDLHSKESRQRLAKGVMAMFNHWGLPVADQEALLGCSRRSLSRYRQGKPLRDHVDLIGRAGHLLGIHKSLRILFPHNRDMVYRWVTTPHRLFEGARPVEIMRQGYEGLFAVRRYLELEQEK